MSTKPTSEVIGRLAAELVLIVVGVLIALAADSWMNDREVARRTDESILLLIAELERDSVAMARFIQAVPAKESATGEFLHARPGDPVADSQAVAWLRAFWVAQVYSPGQAVFLSLAETDALRHVGDAQLQVQLLRYYGEHQGRVEYWFRLRYDRLSRLTDLFSRHLRLEPATEVVGRGYFLEYAELENGWAALRGDAALATEVGVLRIFERQMTDVVEEALRENSELRQNLGELVSGR